MTPAHRTFAALALAAALTPPAAAFDLAKYLALTPGNWAILQDTASGAQSGYVSSKQNGQIMQTWYNFQGGAWVFDSAELFVVTAKKISYLGSNDGSTTWLFEPAITLPRNQSVGDSTVYKGLLRNQTTGEATPVTSAISVTGADIAVSVPAGSFTKCIKLRNYSQGGGSSRDSVAINCANRTEMKSWYNKLHDTGVPTEEEVEQHSSVAVQAGDSNPPLP